MSREYVHRRRFKGFTLVELLVVIGIIAVLVALLLPVLNKATAAAKTVECQSNQQQIMLGIIMFAQDHDDHFPTTAYPGKVNPGTGIGQLFATGPLTKVGLFWVLNPDNLYSVGQSANKSDQALAPNSILIARGYIKNVQVFKCPAASDTIVSRSGFDEVFYYAFSRGLFGNGSAWPSDPDTGGESSWGGLIRTPKLSECRPAYRMAVIVENTGGWSGMLGGVDYAERSGAAVANSGNEAPDGLACSPVHGSRNRTTAVVTYLDGHGEVKTPVGAVIPSYVPYPLVLAGHVTPSMFFSNYPHP